MIQNQWYAVLPSSKVKKNQIVAAKRMNLELAFFRNSQGELGCVADRCSHRGAALSKGEMRGDCVRCPFHGLEFDVGGACKFIPANGIASKQDLSRYNVKHYPVCETNGIVYVWYGEADPAGAEPPFFYDEIDGTYTYSEIEDLWNSHYSRCIENQLDVVHVPIVHYNTIGRGCKTLINGPKVTFENGVLLTSANNERDVGQKPKPPVECEIKSTYLKFIYPNLWLNHIADKIKVLIYFAPVDDENTILYIRFYNNLTPMRWVNAIIAFVGKYMNRVIERQDKRVVITQKPKASAYHSGEKLLTGDGPIILYRKIRDEYQRKS